MKAGIGSLSAGLAAIVLLVACAAVTRAANDKTWSTESYRIRIHMAVDPSTSVIVDVASLAAHVEQQIHRTLYPFWKSNLTLHSRAQRTVLLQQFDRLDVGDQEFEFGKDKTLFLVVCPHPGGVHLACREYDSLMGRWTPVVSREVRQELLLPQHCYELLCETFAPRALLQVDPQQISEAALDFQGSRLLSDDNLRSLFRPSEVFQPYLVRTGRSGSTVGKVLEIPWTYVVAESADHNSWNAKVFSGTRRPFGARRRAGIDVVALELKPVTPATRVRFHAVHDPAIGLAGYEAFEKLATGSQFRPVGFTDQDGSILVKRGEFPITFVALRNEAQPLVQVPVAPGAVAEVEIPVSDDAARLLVQETLMTFKEQMVDIVARRNILMARARDQLQKGHKAKAKELLEEIGDLPTRANLDRYLATLERDPASHSDNSRVQAKIDGMFAESRKLMSTYLTTRELLELESEINRSTSAASE